MEAQYLKSLKASFDKDGYVYIPGFLSPQEVEVLNKHIEHPLYFNQLLFQKMIFCVVQIT